MSENSPSTTTKKTYAENIWTNTEGKIDGYTFKGKRLFSKALVGLKNIMKKGQPNEINNVTFMALDTRIQGAGLEIDVEVSNNKNRGNAVLKIYGPKQDIKKDNTVTVSKSKGSESKFVVILAEKIIIPLMDRFLSGEMEILALLKSWFLFDVSLPHFQSCESHISDFRKSHGLKFSFLSELLLPALFMEGGDN